MIFVSSLSKFDASAADGVVGGRRDLLAAILKVQQASDLGSRRDPAAINAYLDANDLDAHVTVLKDHYREQCAAMVAALRAYFPDEATFTTPAGGFFDRVTLQESIDVDQLLRTQVKPNAHVSYVPSTNFYPAATAMACVCASAA